MGNAKSLVASYVINFDDEIKLLLPLSSYYQVHSQNFWNDDGFIQTT